jgi:hypothetical protein
VIIEAASAWNGWMYWKRAFAPTLRWELLVVSELRRFGCVAHAVSAWVFRAHGAILHGHA